MSDDLTLSLEQERRLAVRSQHLETTHIYEHADPALKEQAIARTAPLGAKPGRYRPTDALLAFLESL
jgi:integrase/recombinase XerD